MPSPSPPNILDDISIFDQSSPESLKARARSPQLHDFLSSTSDEQTLNADVESDYVTYKQARPISSSRSSISSFPGSVIHNTPFTDTEDIGPRTPSRSQSYDRTLKAPAPGYLSAFRNPSSVRALQLESEWADSDTSSSGHNPYSRRSPRLSRVGSRSPGSVHSSPAKRLSRSATPKLQSSKLKKEFPLVLLHCSLLPPAATAYGPLVADEILQAVLPEKYRKRWKTLQDKVVKNNEVKQRGVLISHPREDYDLLEERLLESLELERPRIRRGHFLGRKSGDSDSGFESSSQNGADEPSDPEDKQETKHEKCSDCGTSVSQKVEQDRHWEIKVFAANGLMKSGAWAAAWEEMEKVDVEVGIWMPEDVRVEVEERLKALKAMEEAERPIDAPQERRPKHKRTRSNTAKVRHDERMREIYGEKTEAPMQEKTGSAGTAQDETHAQPEAPVSSAIPAVVSETPEAHLDLQQEDFISFMRRHARIICQDQRNLAIVLLSILVLLFSFQNANSKDLTSQPSHTSAQNTTLQHTTSLIVTTPSVSYITETVIATQPIPATSEAVLYQNNNAGDVQLDKSAGIIGQTPLPGQELDLDQVEVPNKNSGSICNIPDGKVEVSELFVQELSDKSGRPLDGSGDFCTNIQDIILNELLGLDHCTWAGMRGVDTVASSEQDLGQIGTY